MKGRFSAAYGVVFELLFLLISGPSKAGNVMTQFRGTMRKRG